MLRKLRIVLVTIVLRLMHPRSLIIKDFQDVRFNTEFVTQNKGRIELGRRITAFKRVTFVANGGAIFIGDHCFFNRNCIVASLDQITIGHSCIFGPNVIIYDHDHKFNHEGIIHGEYKTSPIAIDDNCWIGGNVTILRGTHIGEGCVIGAGTVIKGEIPAHSIVLGNRSIEIKRLESDYRSEISEDF